MSDNVTKSEIFTPDNLMAGDTGDVVGRTGILITGENRARGTLLGRITKSCPATGAATQGNAGNGTVTGVLMGLLAMIGAYVLKCISQTMGAISTPTTGTANQGNAGANTMTGVLAGARVKTGTYTATCIDATVGGSEVFEVTDPDGLLLAPATVGTAYVDAQLEFTINDPGANAEVGDKFTVLASAVDSNSGVFQVVTPSGELLAPAVVGSPYVSKHINFTLNDGTDDFEIGDTFTITVAAGSLKYKKSLAAAVDGSQEPDAILAKDTDATSADVTTSLYVAGPFNENAITYGAGHTADSVREALRAKNINLLPSVTA